MGATALDKPAISTAAIRRPAGAIAAPAMTNGTAYTILSEIVAAQPASSPASAIARHPAGRTIRIAAPRRTTAAMASPRMSLTRCRNDDCHETTAVIAKAQETDPERR